MLFTTANCWVERCHSEFSALSPGMATVLKESVNFCAKMYLGNVKSCIRNHLAKWLQSISLPVSRRCGNAEEVQNTITELRSQLPNIDEWSRGNPGGGDNEPERIGGTSCPEDVLMKVHKICLCAFYLVSGWPNALCWRVVTRRDRSMMTPSSIFPNSRRISWHQGTTGDTAHCRPRG